MLYSCHSHLPCLQNLGDEKPYVTRKKITTDKIQKDKAMLCSLCSGEILPGCSGLVSHFQLFSPATRSTWFSRNHRFPHHRDENKAVVESSDTHWRRSLLSCPYLAVLPRLSQREKKTKGRWRGGKDKKKFRNEGYTLCPEAAATEKQGQTMGTLSVLNATITSKKCHKSSAAVLNLGGKKSNAPNLQLRTPTQARQNI